MSPKGGNPFAGGMSAEKRQAMMAQLRQDRAVDAPAPAPTEAPEAAEAPTPAQATPEPPKAAHEAPSEAPKADPATAVLQEQYNAREAAVKAAEAKVREAHTATERRAAEAEKKEAEASAKLKRLELVASDPIQFLTESGMSAEDFQAYLASGQKQTPAQRRQAENERQLQALRDELKTMREEQSRSVANAAREREDQAFMSHLTRDEYALVNSLGGMPIVRARQAELKRTLGREVTLEESAGHFEKDLQDTLKRMLEN